MASTQQFLNRRVAPVALILLSSGPLPAGEVFTNENREMKATTYTLKQGNTVARVVPKIGANVFSLEHLGTEYLERLTWVEEFSAWWGGVPILYPTPNRVRNGRFTFAGQDVAFKPNFGEHHIHGLVFDQPWDVVETATTSTTASITLAVIFNPQNDHLAQFPYTHRLKVNIEVSDGAARWTYTVDNSDGEGTVPFGFGLHPIFRYQGSREQTWVTLPVTHQMEAKDVFPSGKLVPMTELGHQPGEPFSLQDRSLDDVFWGLQPDQPARVEFRDKQRSVTMHASDSFSHAVVWSPDFPFFSVEHQTSSTDAHNLHAAGFVREASLQFCPQGKHCNGFVEYRLAGGTSFDWVWEDEGFKLSEQHCQSCHGIAFSGARATSLWDRDWQHARGDSDLGRLITEGIPDLGMPAFKDMLSSREIEKLAQFMVELLKTTPGKILDQVLENAHTEPRHSSQEVFRLETVAPVEGIPWSMAFLPDGRMIFTEKEGRVRTMNDGAVSEPIAGTPGIALRQDAGLLAIAPAPDFSESGWIYLAFADPGKAPLTSMLRIVRGRIRDNRWHDEEDIWSVPQAFYSENNSHYGTRFLIKGEHLFFSVGDRGQRPAAQDLASPFGKIHRINHDGSIPADNPFRKDKAAWPSVWSYGHRNPQGLALEPSGVIWSAEHGPRGGDELNAIRAAGNYGWPRVTHGTEDDAKAISSHSSLPGMIDPILVWKDGIAPSNLGFYHGDRFPHWKGSLFVASLGGQEFRRLTLQDGKVSSQELLLKSIGRIRDVQAGPDGYIYLAVERGGGNSVIARLVPAPAP